MSRSRKTRRKKGPRRVEAGTPAPPMTENPAAAGQAVPVTTPSIPPPGAAQPPPDGENLLERARTQWQFGDWESLAALECDALEGHPGRAELALLAATGHQQLGDPSATRQFVQLARNWGCNKRLVSRALVAGVYNTLGRAAAANGQIDQATANFEAAIATGAPESDIRSVGDVRMNRQLAQLNLPRTPPTRPDPRASLSPSVAASAAEVIPATLQDQAWPAQLVKPLRDDLRRLREQLASLVKKEALNTARQIEAFLDVQNYLRTGELTGEMHGWPISPDFALYLIRLLETNDYDLVIEFGSGTSTVLMARALSRVATRRKDKPAAVQVAFEHLEEFHTETLIQLRQAGLADAVRLVLAPLQPYTAPDGRTYSYYTCHDVLAELAKSLEFGDMKILVMVDGPPAKTGNHARYPAAPVVSSHFPGTQTDILLDDYGREDEKEITHAWLTDLEKMGRQASVIEKKNLEKGACLVRLPASRSNEAE